MIYTGIGSRETPLDVRMRFTVLARLLGEGGAILRTGGAPGADNAFLEGALSVDAHVELYLPWQGFNKEELDPLYDQYPWTNVKIYTAPTVEAYAIAAYFHPYYSNLKRGARSLQARNSHQVLGRDIRTRDTEILSDLVICWTENGKRQGGTGQALRIAENRGVPIIDFGLPLTENQCVDIL